MYSGTLLITQGDLHSTMASVLYTEGQRCPASTAKPLAIFFEFG